jgi:hypothetical protein
MTDTMTIQNTDLSFWDILYNFSFNSKKLVVLNTECVCVFMLSLKIDSDCFPKRLEPMSRCNGDAVCSLQTKLLTAGLGVTANKPDKREEICIFRSSSVARANGSKNSVLLTSEKHDYDLP